MWLKGEIGAWPRFSHLWLQPGGRRQLPGMNNWSTAGPHTEIVNKGSCSDQFLSVNYLLKIQFERVFSSSETAVVILIMYLYVL